MLTILAWSNLLILVLMTCIANLLPTQKCWHLLLIWWACFLLFVISSLMYLGTDTNCFWGRLKDSPFFRADHWHLGFYNTSIVACFCNHPERQDVQHFHTVLHNCPPCSCVQKLHYEVFLGLWQALHILPRSTWSESRLLPNSLRKSFISHFVLMSWR